VRQSGFVAATFNRSNNCRPKRLKLEQQTRPLRLQCVGTKKMYRSATGLTQADQSRLKTTVAANRRGDEPEMKL
jgi:hypothetical protein